MNFWFVCLNKKPNEEEMEVDEFSNFIILNFTIKHHITL